MLLFFLYFILSVANLYSNEFINKVRYPFTTDPIDVVIPCHAKDVVTLNKVIEGVRHNVKNINRIFIVSKRPFTRKAEWFDESQFPFTKETIALEIFEGDKEKAYEFLHAPLSRVGWIYQQLLKLYAPFVIPGISPNILIIDADTIFLRPIMLMDKYGRPIFNVGKEYTEPYFEHGNKVMPGFKKVFPKFSGITNYMLFQRCVLEDMFTMITDVHGIEPWKALCRNINKKYIYAGISEYELYFNFIFLRSNQAYIRKLKWTGLHLQEFKQKQSYYKKRYDFVSCHSWMRS